MGHLTMSGLWGPRFQGLGGSEGDLPANLSVPWLLRQRNRAAAATCGHGRCELPSTVCILGAL